MGLWWFQSPHIRLDIPQCISAAEALDLVSGDGNGKLGMIESIRITEMKNQRNRKKLQKALRIKGMHTTHPTEWIYQTWELSPCWPLTSGVFRIYPLSRHWKRTYLKSKTRFCSYNRESYFGKSYSRHLRYLRRFTHLKLITLEVDFPVSMLHKKRGKFDETHCTD
jgi:hypothetical protein